MKTKQVLSFLVAAAMTITLAACGKGEDNTKEQEQVKISTPQVNRVITNNNSEPKSLDPGKAEGTHESFPLMNLFTGLTRINSEGKIENALAEKIDVTEDGMHYTVTLKDGLKWSNDMPLTAHDFEYAWKRVLNPEFASPYAYQLYYIKNGEKYNQSKATIDDVGVKAVDDKTLKIDMEKPTAYFESLMAFYTLFPVCEAVDKENPNWANSPDTYVSNGPCVLTKWEHNNLMSMDKNPNYYDAENITIDGIDLDIIEDQNTAYQKYVSGDYNVLIDIPAEVVEKLKKENNEELIIGKVLGTYYYSLNENVRPLNNPKVRRALSLAIDRNIITEKVTKGGQIPATGLVPVGLIDDEGNDFTEANKGIIKTDVEEAKKLLEEGLKEENMKPEDVTLTILYNTMESHKAIAQVIQQMWNENLGINTKLENVEFKVKLDREKKHDFDVDRAGWIADYEDPMTFLDMWVIGSPQNSADFHSREFDKLIEEAKSSIDPKVRFDAMKKAERIFLEDGAAIPIYFYTSPYVVKPNVTGIYKPLTHYPILSYARIQLDK